MTKATVEGGEELIRKLHKMGVDVDKLISAAAKAGAEIIADAANPMAPEPIITTEETDSGQRRSQVDVGLPEDKWYLGFFETGVGPHQIGGPLTIKWGDEIHVYGSVSHPGMAARPFLRPAFDAKASQKEASPAAKKVGDVLLKAIERQDDA